MAPHAPAVRVAAIDHLLHPETDLVERRDVPARVMQSGAVRLGEGDQVMVAGMRAVQEGDDVAGVIGQAQPQRVRIERAPIAARRS